MVDSVYNVGDHHQFLFIKGFPSSDQPALPSRPIILNRGRAINLIKIDRTKTESWDILVSWTGIWRESISQINRTFSLPTE